MPAAVVIGLIWPAMTNSVRSRSTPASASTDAAARPPGVRVMGRATSAIGTTRPSTTRPAQNGIASGPATSASVASRSPYVVPPSPTSTWRARSTDTRTRATDTSSRIDGMPNRRARARSWSSNRWTA